MKSEQNVSLEENNENNFCVKSLSKKIRLLSLESLASFQYVNSNRGSLHKRGAQELRRQYIVEARTDLENVMYSLFLFYKNHFYKNIEAEICPKI